MPIELPSTPTNLGGIIAPSGLTIPSPLKTIPSVASGPVLFDSLVFDGTSMLSNTEYHPEISGIGQQYTIALLVKVNDVSNLQCIASFGKTTSHSYRTVGIDPNGGDPRFFGGSGATYRRLGSTSVVPEVGKWYGITLTMQAAGNGQNLQVNGFGLNYIASDGNLTGVRSHSTNGICTLGGRYGNNDLFTGEVGMFLVIVDPHYLSADLKWLQNAPYSTLPSAVRTDTVINLLDQDREWNATNILDSVNSHIFPVTSGVTNSNDTIPDGGYSTGWVNDGSWEGDGINDYIKLIDQYNPTTEIGTGDFSVVIRFKTNGFAANQTLLTWQEDSPSNLGYFNILVNTSQKVRLSFRRQGTNNVDQVQFATTLSADTWYTVIVTRTGTSIDAWLNGTDHVDETDNIGTDGGLSFATDFNADDHNLGRHRTSYNGLWLDGHICQYAIFNNRVLTADEAEVIHGGGVPHDLTTSRTYNSKTYTPDPSTLDLYASLNAGIDGNLSLTGLLVNRVSSSNLIGVNAGGTWSADYPS